MMSRRFLPFAIAATLFSGCPGCPDEKPSATPAADASVDAARDAGGRARRGRRRRGVRVAANTNARTNADPQAPAQPEDEADDMPRPRITETGPMLPENLGPAPEVNYDMGGAGEGPLGIAPEQVTRGMNPLMGRLGNCAAATTDDQGNGPHGRVSVRLRIRNDGRPIAARVSGGGGPPEFITCVRRVVASARFESFRGPDAMVGWGFDVD